MNVAPGNEVHPSVPPSLTGGVDLAEPISMMLRATVGRLAGHGVACVVVALDDKGQLSLDVHAPRGITDVLGMLSWASTVTAVRTLKQPDVEAR